MLPADPSARPDPQILASRDLGDGSTVVCDTGAAPEGGGVPGIDPPDFGPGQDVTDALRDLMCRFSVQATTDLACTLDRYGQFSFISPDTRRQFCFQVPQTVVFPDGDTIVGAQLRDTAGNLGPRKEILIRVGAP